MSLEEGIFILSRTITNPRPDRRTRDQWQKANEWEKGMRFVIRRAHWIERDRAEAMATVPGERRVFELRYLGERYADYVNLFEKDGIVEHARGNFPDEAEQAMLVLVTALVRSTDRDDELDWIFRSRGERMADMADGVLYRLVDRGTVKLDDIRAALAEWDAEEAAKEEAAKAKP
jgi:hypothetical protein